MIVLKEKLKRRSWILAIQIRIWCAEQPITAIVLVISLSVILLPLVTAIALTPLVAIFEFSDYVVHQGIIYTMYVFIVRGLLFTLIIFVLFLLGFTMACIIGILYKNLISNTSRIP